MAKTAVVKARIEPELKENAENILRQLGMTPTEAVTIFYQQIKFSRGLPFAVTIPNEVTLQTFRDTDAGKNVVQTQSKDDLFEQLDL
jgi:DNA-damage-inducible protein J